MKKSKRRSYRHLFRIGGFGGNQTVNIAVPCVNAKRIVKLERTEADVLRGKPGIAVACANAKCAMDGKGSFPHPVYLAEFTKSYCYIVDRLDRQGQPAHCVRYRHDDESWISKFDVPGGKAKLIASGDARRTVTLSMPPHRKPQTGSGVREGRKDGSRTSHLPKLAQRRAIDAGWVIDPRNGPQGT